MKNFNRKFLINNQIVFPKDMCYNHTEATIISFDKRKLMIDYLLFIKLWICILSR